MLTKDKIAQIRKDMETALAQVTAKHGVTFNIGIIRFGADSMRCKLEAVDKAYTAAASSSAPTVSVEMHELITRGQHILPVSFDVTKTYSSSSLGRVKFVGYHARKPKYPFIVQTAAGKRFKITKAAAQSMVAVGAV